MTVNRCPIAAAAALIIVATGCSAIRRAHDDRLTAWERSGITVEQAREILGSSPHAVPDLEIVTIHLDAPSQVVMVYQRVKPGVLVSLSQHRGQHVGPNSRAFWAASESTSSAYHMGPGRRYRAATTYRWRAGPRQRRPNSCSAGSRAWPITSPSGFGETRLPSRI